MRGFWDAFGMNLRLGWMKGETGRIPEWAEVKDKFNVRNLEIGDKFQDSLELCKIGCSFLPDQMHKKPKTAFAELWHSYMNKTLNNCSVSYTMNQGCSLETLVLVSRHLEDMKNGRSWNKSVGLEENVLVLTKKSQYFQDLDEWQYKPDYK